MDGTSKSARDPQHLAGRFQFIRTLPLSHQTASGKEWAGPYALVYDRKRLDYCTVSFIDKPGSAGGENRLEEAIQKRATVSFPGIPPVIKWGDSDLPGDSRWYVVYPESKSVSLGDFRSALASSRKLNWLDSVKIIQQICFSLEYLHRKTLTIPELGFDSIWLTLAPTGEMADLGVQAMLVTLPYDEQMQDRWDTVRRIGGMLYYLTVAPQEKLESSDIGNREKYRTLPAPRSVDPNFNEHLERIILWAMQADKKVGYADPGAVAGELAQILSDYEPNNLAEWLRRELGELEDQPLVGDAQPFELYSRHPVLKMQPNGKPGSIEIIVSSNSPITDKIWLALDTDPKVDPEGDLCHLIPETSARKPFTVNYETNVSGAEFIFTLFVAPLDRKAPAGSYPVQITLHSATRADAVSKCKVDIEIEPVIQLVMSDVWPQKMQAGETAHLRLENRGNIPETIELQPIGTDSAVRFVPTRTLALLRPSSNMTVDLQPHFHRRPLLGRGVERDYSVRVRSRNEGQIQTVSGAVSAQSILSYWALAGMLALVVVLFGFTLSLSGPRLNNAIEPCNKESFLKLINDAKEIGKIDADYPMANPDADEFWALCLPSISVQRLHLLLTNSAADDIYEISVRGNKPTDPLRKPPVEVVYNGYQVEVEDGNQTARPWLAWLQPNKADTESNTVGVLLKPDNPEEFPVIARDARLVAYRPWNFNRSWLLPFSRIERSVPLVTHTPSVAPSEPKILQFCIEDADKAERGVCTERLVTAISPITATSIITEATLLFDPGRTENLFLDWVITGTTDVSYTVEIKPASVQIDHQASSAIVPVPAQPTTYTLTLRDEVGQRQLDQHRIRVEPPVVTCETLAQANLRSSPGINYPAVNASLENGIPAGSAVEMLSGAVDYAQNDDLYLWAQVRIRDSGETGWMARHLFVCSQDSPEQMAAALERVEDPTWRAELTALTQSAATRIAPPSATYQTAGGNGASPQSGANGGAAAVAAGNLPPVVPTFGPTSTPTETPTVAPTPTATSAPRTDIRLDKSIIRPGECAQVTWTIVNVAAVYVDLGEGEFPSDNNEGHTEQVCDIGKQRILRWRIIERNGNERIEERKVEVKEQEVKVILAPEVDINVKPTKIPLDPPAADNVSRKEVEVEVEVNWTIRNVQYTEYSYGFKGAKPKDEKFIGNSNKNDDVIIIATLVKDEDDGEWRIENPTYEFKWRIVSLNGDELDERTETVQLELKKSEE